MDTFALHDFESVHFRPYASANWPASLLLLNPADAMPLARVPGFELGHCERLAAVMRTKLVPAVQHIQLQHPVHRVPLVCSLERDARPHGRQVHGDLPQRADVGSVLRAWVLVEWVRMRR